jgi:hypothetical protein
VRRSDRRHEIGDAGPFGRRDHCRTPGGARETVGHERRALLMARQDEADLRRRAQRIDHREVLCPGNAKDMVDAFAQQRIYQRAGACYRAYLSALTCIHAIKAPVCGRTIRLESGR